jgi:hypothetical protein
MICSFDVVLIFRRRLHRLPLPPCADSSPRPQQRRSAGREPFSCAGACGVAASSCVRRRSLLGDNRRRRRFVFGWWFVSVSGRGVSAMTALWVRDRRLAARAVPADDGTFSPRRRRLPGREHRRGRLDDEPLRLLTWTRANRGGRKAQRRSPRRRPAGSSAPGAVSISCPPSGSRCCQRRVHGVSCHGLICSCRAVAAELKRLRRRRGGGSTDTELRTVGPASL